MPVRGESVFGAVLHHGGEYQSVGQDGIADFVGREKLGQRGHGVHSVNKGFSIVFYCPFGTEAG